MQNQDIYQEPRAVLDINECYFYHTIDIPGYGLVEGPWDLRDSVDQYLGKVTLKGKRILEIGTASGFVCFYMESQGGEVVAYDLSENQSWDIIPFSRYNNEKFSIDRKEHIKQLNNSFWFCHKAFNSKSKMVYGSVYAIPAEIGLVDITTFGCVLLHVRDPFLALQNALRLTKDTVIITEPYTRKYLPLYLFSKFGKAYMKFLPKFAKCEPKETWWVLSPEIIKNFIGVLGFEKSKVTYHFQKINGVKRMLFTVIGQRTKRIND